MDTIERHDVVDAATAQSESEFKAQLIEKTLPAVPRNPSLLNQLQLAARERAGYLSVLDGQRSEICRALRTAKEALVAAMTTAAASPSDEVTVALGDGRPVRLPSAGPTSYSDVGNWCTGFFIAAICRDKKALDMLSHMSVDLLRRSSSRADEYYYLFAEALQSFWRGQADAADRLEAALEATAPEQLKIAPAEFALNIIVPQMELLYRRMIGEPSAFNNALEQALKLHRKYWSKGRRKHDPNGYLAVGPLAIASLALEGGIAINVRSAYMPEDLVQKGCEST